MMKSRWVATLVAVPALALGSVGTATAGGLTKHEVKKIAAKVIAKKAPGLSVGHAATADRATTATTAGSASTAGSATTAGDATKLGGQPPASYLDRAAYVGGGLTTFPTANAVVQIGPSVSIEVPANTTYVAVTGMTSVDNDGTAGFEIWIQSDSTCTNSGDGYAKRTYSKVDGEISLANQYLDPVYTGTHVFRLCGRAGAPGPLARGASLLARTVATDQTGLVVEP